MPVGQPGIILVAPDQQLLLLPEFPKLGVRHQAVGHLPEGGSHGELVQGQGLLLLGLGGLEGEDVLAAGENGLESRGPDGPDSGSWHEQAGQIGAPGAKKTGQGNLREKIGPGRADAVVGGDEHFLGLADVRPPLQEFRGEAGGHRGPHHQFGERLPPGNGLGVLPQNNTDAVFLLGNLALLVGNPGPRGMHQGLDLIDVLLGDHPPFKAHGDQTERILVGLEGAAGNLQLLVQSAQLKIGPGHLGHHRGEYRPAGPFGGKELCFGGLRQAPEPSEQVDFPKQVKVELRQVVRGLERGARGRVAGFGEAFPLVEGHPSQLGQPGRAAYPHQGPGLGHPGRGQTQVIVGGQGFPDELLEHGIVEKLPPGEIRQGFELGARLARQGLEAILLGHLLRITLVLGGQHTTA